MNPGEIWPALVQQAIINHVAIFGPWSPFWWGSIWATPMEVE